MRKNVSTDRKNIIFLLSIFVMVASLTVFLALYLREDPVEESLKNNPVIDVLWVLDDGMGNALTTNFMVYYPQAKKGALFDVLGNTGAIYASLGRVDRIDAIYAEKGIGLYCQEIEKLMDKSIPFTIEISIDDFAVLADLLGGFSVFVPSPVDMTGPEGERWLLPSGVVNLDGDKIKMFMTYKLPEENESDIEDRRQSAFVAFLSALRENRKTFLSKKNFQTFAQGFRSNVDKDNLYTLLGQISDVDTDHLVPRLITGSERVVDGKKLLFPYYDGRLIKDVVNQAISSLVNEKLGGQNRVYVVSIENGTPRQGLARNTAFLLQSAGYEILEWTNADKSDYDKTVIINRIGNADAALSLGEFIKCKNIVDEDTGSGSDESSSTDFTIILGNDFDGRYVRASSSVSAD